MARQPVRRLAFGTWFSNYTGDTGSIETFTPVLSPPQYTGFPQSHSSGCTAICGTTVPGRQQKKSDSTMSFH